MALSACPAVFAAFINSGGRVRGWAERGRGVCWSAQRGARGRVLGSALSRPLDAISAAHLHADIIATFNYEYAITFELRKLRIVGFFKNSSEDFYVFPWCSLLGVRAKCTTCFCF